MNDQQTSNRGLEASQILGSQAYIDAMQALRESIVAKWKEVGLRDTEGQKLTLQMMKLADTFENVLAGYIEAGKFAAHKMDMDSARDETPARRFMRRVL